MGDAASDRAYHRVERLAFKHVPRVQRLARDGDLLGPRDATCSGFAYQPAHPEAVEAIARAQHRASGINDPRAARAVTPNWQIGCKRILISNDWYPTLARDDVDLVTDGIAEIRRHAGSSPTDGTVREVDAIVVATGFHVTDSPTFERIVGSDGRSLGRRLGRQGPAGLQGQRPSRASRTCCSSSARTPASGTARWST